MIHPTRREASRVKATNLVRDHYSSSVFRIDLYKLARERFEGDHVCVHVMLLIIGSIEPSYTQADRSPHLLLFMPISLRAGFDGVTI